MIAHQSERMNQPAIPLAHLAQRIEKHLEIAILSEYRLLMISATHHVIGRTFKFNSWFSCHIRTKTKTDSGLKLENDESSGLTPF